MAVTLTTSWQNIASAQVSYLYEYQYTWTITLQARYTNQSGNSATVRVRAVITNNSSPAWYGSNKGYNINNNGYVEYTPTVNGGASFTTNEYDAGTLSGGGSRSLSGSWTVMGTYSATASETVVMPNFIVAPTKPTISIVADGPYSNKITFGTASFGQPNTGTVYLYGGTTATPTAQLTSKTTTGSTTFTHSNLTPGATYYYRARAYNGSVWSDYSDVVSIETKRAVFVPYPNDPTQANTTKLVSNLLVPFNGLTRNIIKLYRGNADDEAERIY